MVFLPLKIQIDTLIQLWNIFLGMVCNGLLFSCQRHRLQHHKHLRHSLCQGGRKLTTIGSLLKMDFFSWKRNSRKLVMKMPPSKHVMFFLSKLNCHLYIFLYEEWDCFSVWELFFSSAIVGSLAIGFVFLTSFFSGILSDRFLALFFSLVLSPIHCCAESGWEPHQCLAVSSPPSGLDSRL